MATVRSAPCVAVAAAAAVDERFAPGQDYFVWVFLCSRGRGRDGGPYDYFGGYLHKGCGRSMALFTGHSVTAATHSLLDAAGSLQASRVLNKPSIFILLSAQKKGTQRPVCPHIISDRATPPTLTTATHSDTPRPGPKGPKPHITGITGRVCPAVAVTPTRAAPRCLRCPTILRWCLHAPSPPLPATCITAQSPPPMRGSSH